MDVDRTIEPGEDARVGRTALRVALHTPGHTAGMLVVRT